MLGTRAIIRFQDGGVLKIRRQFGLVRLKHARHGNRHARGSEKHARTVLV
jgi:hypothetical protein